MRDLRTDAVLVVSAGQICGIVTDRDLAVRVLAARRDPDATRLDRICSTVSTAGDPQPRSDPDATGATTGRRG